MHIAIFVAQLLALFTIAQGLPLTKRLYRPSSQVFSIIAHHEGKVFQYNLLKWDGEDLVLNADEEAFFGRVRASEGYILNLPGSDKSSNGTQTVADTVNVHVNPSTYKLTTTTSAANSTHGFGITAQKLTYKNSTGFLACPNLNYRGEYSVYWGNKNQTNCPFNATGYNIELIVQTDATVNYNPLTNTANTTVTLNSTSSSNSKRFYFF